MSRAQRRHAPANKGFNWKLWGSIALIIIVFGSIIVLKNARGTGVDYTQYTYTDEQFARPNATHTLEEFSDFQCPACQVTSPSIRALRDTAPDSVRVVYRHFPLRSIHPYAQGAAEASECARDQNKFWAYHDVLFESVLLDPSSLKLHAEGLGLDMDAWNACMSGATARTRVQADLVEGQQRGVQGTPTIFVDGQLYTGARSVTEFQRAMGIN